MHGISEISFAKRAGDLSHKNCEGNIQRRIYDLAATKSRAGQGESAGSLQPQTNPKYQFVNALYLHSAGRWSNIRAII
jgi:hypothetical protein